MFKNKTVIVVIAMCIVKLTLHLIADYNSGFQADEFLHIETGHHPAMGYMEFPPAIGWLAFIQNLFHSQSVFIHHIFTHIAAILIMVICAMITIALGGKTKAVFMLLLCIIVAPAFGRSQQLFQPVVFSQLFWLLSFLQLVHFVKTVKTKYILYLALSLTAGFLTKYDIVFFIAGLTGLLFFKETRTALLKTATLKYVLLSLLIISPNIYWQIQHQFPVLQMFSRLYETQLNKLSVADVFKNIFISLNPFTAVFWIAGLLFMFNKKDKFIYRPIVACVLLSICFLALSKSKAYYF
ncbi:MAG: glycosyltransferase family 39 protein, partial [Ferruginibacter sp.]